MTTSIQRRIVLYTECPTTGGVSAVVEEVAVTSTPYECIVICGNSSTLQDWGKRLRARGIDVRHIALSAGGWFAWKNIAKVVSIFRKSSLINFHLHTTFSCIPAIFIARLFTDCRIVITEHYISQLRFLRNRQLPAPLAGLREIVIAAKLIGKRISLLCIDAVVTVSNSNLCFFQQTFGGTSKYTATSIPNGVDVLRFAQMENKHPDGAHDLVVATIAGLNSQKGHLYLIQAIPFIRRQCPDSRFVFAGDGHLRSHLEELARGEGILESIAFVGHLEDVRPLLSTAALVILPSLFEGMPISILEAMAAGKAVVATDVDGTAEVVVDGQTGFLVPPRNPEELAKKAIRLLKDSELRDRFGRQGKERVRKNFSLDQMSRLYFQTFEKLLSSS